MTTSQHHHHHKKVYNSSCIIFIVFEVFSWYSPCVFLYIHIKHEGVKTHIITTDILDLELVTPQRYRKLLFSSILPQFGCIVSDHITEEHIYIYINTQIYCLTHFCSLELKRHVGSGNQRLFLHAWIWRQRLFTIKMVIAH